MTNPFLAMKQSVSTAYSLIGKRKPFSIIRHWRKSSQKNNARTEYMDFDKPETLKKHCIAMQSAIQQKSIRHSFGIWLMCLQSRWMATRCCFLFSSSKPNPGSQKMIGIQ